MSVKVITLFALLFAAVALGYDTKYTPSLFILDHCSPEGNDYLLFWVDAAAEGHITQNEVDGVINLIDFHEQCESSPHIQFNREIQIGPSLSSAGTPGEVRYTTDGCVDGTEDLEVYLPFYGWSSLSNSLSTCPRAQPPGGPVSAPVSAPLPPTLRGIHVPSSVNVAVVGGSLVEVPSQRVILDSVVLREKITSVKNSQLSNEFVVSTARGDAVLSCLDETCYSAALVFPNSPEEMCSSTNAGLFEVFGESLFACSKLPSSLPDSSSIYSWVKL